MNHVGECGGDVARGGRDKRREGQEGKRAARGGRSKCELGRDLTDGKTALMGHRAQALTVEGDDRWKEL
jgi:hypothetical protein